jgi:hypothetical protein
MAVNAERLARDMRAIDPSEARIMPLSTYMQLHDARKCSELWFAAIVDDAIDATKMVPLLYLCNDVVQNMLLKNKDNTYAEEMARYLEAACARAAWRDPGARAAIVKLTNLWEKRAVYSAAFMERVRAAARDVQGAGPLPDVAPRPLRKAAREAAAPFVAGEEDLGAEVEVGEEEDPALAGLSAAFGGGAAVPPPPMPMRDALLPSALPAPSSSLPPPPPFRDEGVAALAAGPMLDVLHDMQRRHGVCLSLAALVSTIRPDWTSQTISWAASGGEAAAAAAPGRLPVLLAEAGSAEKAARMVLAAARLTASRSHAAASRLMSTLEGEASSLDRLRQEAASYGSVQGTWARFAEAARGGATVRADRLAAPALPLAAVEPPTLPRLATEAAPAQPAAAAPEPVGYEPSAFGAAVAAAASRKRPRQAEASPLRSSSSGAAPRRPTPAVSEFERLKAARMAVEAGAGQLQDLGYELGDGGEGEEEEEEEGGAGGGAKPAFSYDITGAAKVWDPVRAVWVQDDKKLQEDGADAWRS